MYTSLSYDYGKTLYLRVVLITTVSLLAAPTAGWRHQMETFSALLAICAGNSPVPGEFPAQRPVTRSFDVFFDPRPNKWLSKQPLGWWFETTTRSLWRHCNGATWGSSQYKDAAPQCCCKIDVCSHANDAWIPNSQENVSQKSYHVKRTSRYS